MYQEDGYCKQCFIWGSAEWGGASPPPFFRISGRILRILPEIPPKKVVFGVCRYIQLFYGYYAVIRDLSVFTWLYRRTVSARIARQKLQNALDSEKR